MATEEDIRDQQERLVIYRRVLSRYLKQLAQVGKASAQPVTFEGILEARSNIRRIKATLRDWNVAFEDMPDDEEASPFLDYTLDSSSNVSITASPNYSASSVKKSSPSQMRILCADDDPAVIQLLTLVLQNEGYAVSSASNGDALVRMAQVSMPDLIIVDIMMPGIDGYEAVRQLRNDTRTAHLPILILTSKSASNDLVTGFEAGADDYLTKPFDIPELLARIHGHLRRSSMRIERSPLTDLPGDPILQRDATNLLSRNVPFSLILIDIDSLIAFNATYGFSRGDRVIEMLGKLISNTLEYTDSLYHIGGDDFAIVHNASNAVHICQNIINLFREEITTLYDTEDLARGYIRSMDRNGIPREYGLLSLSMAIVNTKHKRIFDISELFTIASEVLQSAKAISGNSYLAK